MAVRRRQREFTAPPARQRGAALVVAAVFLVAVMVVLGDVTLRLSATDVTDSALQADAVDALFLAESGMEYAAQRFANGISCINLVMGSAVSFGRGDFQVTQATDISGDCRVRVTGRVLFGGSDLRAQRTVEGLLSAGGNVAAIAVGNNGTILHWDGSNWNSVVSGTTGDFSGIDCPDQNNCIAVADNDHYALWDGNSWTNNTNGNLAYTDVACRSDIDDCLATGWGVFIIFPYRGIALWNGASWGLSEAQLASDRYLSISCTAATCHATAESGLLSRWAGGWSNETSVGDPVNGIACPTDNDCWAVGNSSGNRYTIYRRSGSGWSNDFLTSPPARDLYAVDCIAIDDCWAVGERLGGNSYTLLRRAGGSWSSVSHSTSGARNLNGIDCNDSGSCLAVGDDGRVLHYNGSNWSVTTESTESLNDVHYMDGSGSGGVSLLRWWEIIN